MTSQKKLRWSSIGIVLGGLLVSPRAAAQQIAITGATVIDGTGKAPLRDGVVLITDGRIAAVGPSREAVIPVAAKRLDARGKYVIPGLMDANMSVVFIGDVETLIKYEGRYHEIFLEAAQITLKAGLTTVFSVLGPRAPAAKARGMIDAGAAPGSRIKLAGNIIGFDGLFSADFNSQASAQLSKAFVKRTNEMVVQGTGRELMWMPPEEVRSVIREYAQKDVDYLKYAANEHWPGSFITFSPRVQRVIVEEGHKAGLIVQAHTMSIEGLDLAIDAGVDLVTHCSISGPVRTIPEETIRKLVARRIPCSVLAVTQRHLDALLAGSDTLFAAIRKVSKINERNMIKAGATLLVATDAFQIASSVRGTEPGWLAADTADPQFQLGEGHFNALVGLEEMGMQPMEILKSATSHIAKAYKMDADLGTVEAGKIADLVVLDRDPLASARHYRSIHAVIKDGKVVELDALPVAPIVSAKSAAN